MKRSSCRLTRLVLTALAPLALALSMPASSSPTTTPTASRDSTRPRAADRRSTSRSAREPRRSTSWPRRVPANDIVLKLYHNGVLVAQQDTVTSPEAIHYATGADLDTGKYSAVVCPFNGEAVVSPSDYAGIVTVSELPLPPVTIIPPGSTTNPPTVYPIPSFQSWNARFSPATVVDPQRTEGEPLVEARRRRQHLGVGALGLQHQHVLHPPLDQRRQEVPPRLDDRHAPRRAARRRRHGRRRGRPGQRLLRGPRRAADGDRRLGLERQRQHVAQERGGRAADASWTGSGSPWTTARAPAPSTTRSSSPSTRPPWGPSSTRPPARRAATTRRAASSGRTPPRCPARSRRSPADAICAQLRFDKVKRNLYYACNEGDHVRVTVGHVAVGQRIGIAYANYNGPKTPGGGDVLNLFPALATDAAGTRLHGLDRRRRAPPSTTPSRPTRARAGPLRSGSTAAAP